MTPSRWIGAGLLIVLLIGGGVFVVGSLSSSITAPDDQAVEPIEDIEYQSPAGDRQRKELFCAPLVLAPADPVGDFLRRSNEASMDLGVPDEFTPVVLDSAPDALAADAQLLKDHVVEARQTQVATTPLPLAERAAADRMNRWVAANCESEGA